ncbi:hypothetical protein H0H87_005914 [Tephrocybe sp. NHM501043]|nr:hypothetical protein H0H87_005914 [Tephrocybe sp. NHM501043]
MNNLEISIEISLSSPRIQRDSDTLKLLSLFSLIPDTISSEAIRIFENGIPGINYIKKGLSTPIQNALITKNASGCVQILSPIRLHMRARYQPPPDARRFLQDHFFYLVQDAITLDEPLIQARFRAEYGNVETILWTALKHPLAAVWRILVPADSGYMIMHEFNRKAKFSFAEALVLHEQIDDQLGAAYDLMGLGQLHLERKKFQKAKGMFSRALDLFIDNNDQVGRCTALNCLGHTVLSYSRPSDAVSRGAAAKC